MKNIEFDTLSDAEKMERLLRIIRVKTGDTLSESEQLKIKNVVNPARQYCIRVFDNPVDFIKAVTLKDAERKSGEKTFTAGTVLFGTFKFGYRKIKEKNNFLKNEIEESLLSDVDHPAAALLVTRNRGYKSLSVPLSEYEIAIYAPEAQMALAG